MRGYAPFLGQIRLAQVAQPGYSSNRKFAPSASLGAIIPRFPIEISHGDVQKRVDVGLDTGMWGAHIEMPTDLAEDLGLVAVDREVHTDASGSFRVNVAVIEKISVGECSVNKAKVIFFDDAPLLVGNPLVGDLGITVTYGEKGPTIKCSKTSASGFYFPKFEVSLQNKSQLLSKQAIFDTGWETAALAVSQRTADKLGLVVIGKLTAQTHSGTVTHSTAKIERVTVKDLGQCHVDDALVVIHPRGSALDVLDYTIVGEPFFKKTGGMIGYDPEGAFFMCSGSQVARASNIVKPPVPEAIPLPGMPDIWGPAPVATPLVWPYVVGGIGLIGMAAIVGGVLFHTARSS